MACPQSKWCRPSPDLCNPSTPLQFVQSTRPNLLQQGPSGPYYSNPRDVIPKWHCFHCSPRRTICYLTSPKGRPRSSSYFFCSAVPSPSVTVAQRGQRTRPHTDFTVGSLHQQQACSQSLCSFKQYTGFAGLTEAASRTVSVSKKLKTLSGCETVTGSVRCAACRHAQKSSKRWCIISLCGQPQMQLN